MCLALAVSSCTPPSIPPTPTLPPSPIMIYSQTSLAGSTGTTPGLYDQFGLLEGSSPRKDFYQIFTNNTSQAVQINKAILYGKVEVASTAVLVPVMVGTANGVPDILIPDTDPSHVLATASVPVGPNDLGTIEIAFSADVDMPAGEQLAFGFIVPLSDTVDATLFGTDTLPSGLSSTVPPYYRGFYVPDANGGMFLAVGNHYLVIEALP
jgi:hypothetical protein